MSSFQLLIDTVQQRQQDDAVSMLCGKEDWDRATSTNFTVDGTSGTGMLTPAPYLAGWRTSNSGIYAKIPFAGFTFSDANWQAYAINADAAQFYRYNAANSGGISGYTSSDFIANQALVLEAFADNTTADSGVLCEFGLSSTHDGTSGVSFRWYLDGRIEVWKNGLFVGGPYSTAGKAPKYGQVQGEQRGQTRGEFVLLMLIPCRSRELLVISSTGASFSHIFDDIPEGEPDAVITDAAPFWISFPAPVSPEMRLAVLQYAGSAVALSKRCYFSNDPGASPPGGFTGEFYGQIPADSTPGSATVSTVDGVNPALAYAGATDGLRVRVDLIGGTNSSGYTTTPFVRAARVYTSPPPALTSGPSTDVTPYLVSGVHIEGSDTIGGSGGHLVIYDPDAVDEIAGLSTIQIRDTLRRPCQAFADGIQIFEGILMHPKLRIAAGGDDPNFRPEDISAAEEIECDLKDVMQLADDTVVEDTIPLDGVPFDEAYAYVASLAGLNANVSSSYHAYALPSAGDSTGSAEFAVQLRPGDRVSEWLDRLVKTYACTAFHGVQGLDYGTSDPGDLQVIDVADMPTEPALTLYSTAAAAYVATGDESLVFRDLVIESLEPEANHILVEGMDFRSRRPIVYSAPDVDSIDPSIPPDARPLNWLGSRRKCSWVDPSLRTIGDCRRTGDLLFARMTQRRQLLEFTAELQTVLPRGQMIRLVGGRIPGGSVVARIRTLAIDIEHVDDRFTIWRPTRYVAQAGTDASPLNASGTRISHLRADWKLKAISKSVQWGDVFTAGTWSRPRISAAASA